jgi:hypothetical protein
LGLSACAGEEAAPVGAVPTDTPPPTATVSQPPTLIPTFEPDQPGGKADVSSEQATIAPTIPEAEVTMVPSLEQLIKPHFFARSATGNFVEVQGAPDLVLERDGKVKIRMRQGDQVQYLDPLALQSQLLGEHPREKILRLQNLGVPIQLGLASKIEATAVTNDLFQVISFEYLPGKETSGVISEVFPDGTFLVLLSETPPEWQSDRPTVASPTHLHVNPRGLSAGVSALAKEYEEEILVLPFEEQRYPAAPLARKQCDVYQESLQNDRYRDVLEAVGYRFTLSHALRALDTAGKSFGERFSTILSQESGEGIQYFGFEGSWIADRLADLPVSWIGECDTAGGVRSYPSAEDSRDRYFLIVRRSLEPDKKQRYKVLEVQDDGSATELYTAPGIILMAQPLPHDDTRWIMSAEGWKPPDDEGPADPRWQSVYIVNINDPEEFDKVHYPISQFPKALEAGLYGVSPRLSHDQRYLFNTLYGFTDEGGGIWVSDLSEDDYYQRPQKFSRIVAWDHTLSWTVLGDDPDTPSPFLHLFMTGKEVADNFAMTANVLRIKDAGLDSSIEHQERLLQMVGWNPVPFAIQEISDTQFQVAVETHFNYESSLLPRAKGVYIVPVDLSDLDPNTNIP